MQGGKVGGVGIYAPLWAPPVGTIMGTAARNNQAYTCPVYEVIAYTTIQASMRQGRQGVPSCMHASTAALPPPPSSKVP